MSIFKWWHSTNALNCFKFKIVRCVPSFFRTQENRRYEIAVFLRRRHYDAFSDKLINFRLNNSSLFGIKEAWSGRALLRQDIALKLYFDPSNILKYDRSEFPTALGSRAVYQRESCFAAQACFPQHHFVPI